jgi:hypothetical protein
MHTEFTRRVTTIDLCISHIVACSFYIPLKYLRRAPFFEGLFYTSMGLYLVCFYVFMSLMKLTKSVWLQIMSMLLCVSYVAMMYGFLLLGRTMSAAGMPPPLLMYLNLLAIVLVIATERNRVNQSDPLDYNHTSAQKATLRMFDRKKEKKLVAFPSISSPSTTTSALRKGTSDLETGEALGGGAIEQSKFSSLGTSSPMGQDEAKRRGSSRSPSRTSSASLSSKNLNNGGGLFGGSKKKYHGGVY